MANPMHGTLVSDTVATVTLDNNYRGVEITNRGTVDIFFLVDPGATAPAVEGNASEVVAAGKSVVVKSRSNATTVVKLKATGTPKYSVKGLREF